MANSSGRMPTVFIGHGSPMNAIWVRRHISDDNTGRNGDNVG